MESSLERNSLYETSNCSLAKHDHGSMKRMKRIWLIGRSEGLAQFSNRMKLRGYSIRHVRNFGEVKKLLRTHSPDFMICTGKIQADENGDFYIEM